MIQATLKWPEEDRDPPATVVSICCRECDAEVTLTRADAASLGWYDWCFERNEPWTWFDFSAVCPQCSVEAER